MDLKIKVRRVAVGLTQLELAQRAGLSLPLIQNLERGEGNPSLETLERLGAVLGFRVTLQNREPDWKILSQGGVPLLVPSRSSGSEPPVERFSSDEFFLNLRFALAELSSAESRVRSAVLATLLAIRDHFPSYFKKYFGKSRSATNHLAQLEVSGTVIKLRRIALSKLSRWL